MPHLQPFDPSILKWSEQTSSLTLPLPDLFRYEHNLGYLSRSTNECLFHVDNLSIYKLIQVGDNHVLIAVNSEDNSRLRIQLIHSPGGSLTPSLLENVARYVWEWFDLGTDLMPFYELAKGDPLLKQVTQDFYGLRVMGIPDLFEAISWGIIGQQINLTFAYTLKRRLVEAFGTRLDWEGRTYWAFPTPEQIAELTPDALTALQFTGKKAEYLIGVAKLMAEGLLVKEELLKRNDFTEMEKELLSIRGIGPWTANYVLMRCLRNPAAFPIADVGLHNALKHVLGLEQKPTIPHIRQLAEGWSGWEAYATFYLWRVLY
ncbi:DNA-3-methyladenine glycosylase 2 [Paenibacillus alginolyticus]|uniref:DNA-3-methyladenine glycosylase II n=1 Tax=Paenibacillus alginolyticus TaxID=59839 RepID=A0ABT4G9N0_9BACL|nr:DNA-3-methyladenine glycosylase 2 [Paenibacillus alginolyticus]MCY9692897.1 DNA-3-methyladenine glycosylase 2 [Paenibacillus alginolyticus]MEC0144367.1 DNA-3-methyladenine glycosylase 2 [Paenibacillus alginolyticus]